MIASTDTVALAPGVALRGDRLSDEVRGDSWPLNTSAAFVLARTGIPVARIVDQLAEAFSLPAESARADVLRFIWHLNALALVNVESGGRRSRRLAEWLRLAARLAPAGAMPAVLTRRRAIDTRSVGRAVVSCVAATLPRVGLIAAVAAALAAQWTALAGGEGPTVPLVLGLGTGVGLGLHEAAHAALLRGVPSALVTRGRRTYVLHAPVSHSRRSIVALAGPAVVAGLGVGLVLAGSMVVAPMIAIAGCPLAAHALALTVAGADGRAVCGL